MSRYHVLDVESYKKQYAEDFTKISPFDAGIPLIECEDQTIQQIYYYRWHTFCSHIKETPLGWIVTEFTPNVGWAGIYNSIVCPAGHHMYEGRWLHDQKYIADYARFWFKEGPSNMDYSTWMADSVWAICQVTGDFTLAESMYEDLKQDYANWVTETRMKQKSRLYYQVDDFDGMEYSASGNGCRPTINSYMYGNARALAKIARRLNKPDEEAFYTKEADEQKFKMDRTLWKPEAEFYVNHEMGYRRTWVREEIGFIPWYFNLPDDDKSVAWKFLNDPNYFYAPYGPTTAEQNHPNFMKYYPHDCLWNGPSWPFATSQTITALGNLLNNNTQDVMGKKDYFFWLKLYANSHYLEEDGQRRPFIDEYLDPFTGEWLARKLIRERDPEAGKRERGIYYNHSSFCDLVLTGLAGVRPREDDALEINPLFEEKDLAYFCADGILYHGKSIAVLWDRDGTKYGRGKGLKVYCDGELVAESQTLDKLVI